MREGENERERERESKVNEEKKKYFLLLTDAKQFTEGEESAGKNVGG